VLRCSPQRRRVSYMTVCSSQCPVRRKTRLLGSHLFLHYVNTITLPRQAQDNHRKSSENKGAFSAGAGREQRSTCGPPRRPQYITISWRLQPVAPALIELLSGIGVQGVLESEESLRMGCGKHTFLLRCHFMLKQRSFHQDRLGTNIGKPLKKRDDGCIAGARRTTQTLRQAENQHRRTRSRGARKRACFAP
jgi:hypothetical protein